MQCAQFSISYAAELDDHVTLPPHLHAVSLLRVAYFENAVLEAMKLTNG
jgi:hypothetical protein